MSVFGSDSISSLVTLACWQASPHHRPERIARQTPAAIRPGLFLSKIEADWIQVFSHICHQGFIFDHAEDRFRAFSALTHSSAACRSQLSYVDDARRVSLPFRARKYIFNIFVYLGCIPIILNDQEAGKVAKKRPGQSPFQRPDTGRTHTT